MEYKQFLPESFKSKGEGTARFVIATTEVVDSHGDVLVPGAIGDQVATLLPAHRWDALPLGKARISEQDDLVIADVQFNPTPQGQAWHDAIKWDFDNPPAVQQYSWGYDATRSRPGKLNGEKVRFLEVVKIHEVSPVLIGASIGTHTSMIKGRECLSPAQVAVLRAAQREVDHHETELRDRVKTIADEFRDGECDRLATEVSHATGHDFEIVPAETVPTATRNAAAAAASLAAQQLGTKRPAVRWFKQSKYTLHGRALPNASLIYLNAALSESKTVAIAAHETAHCAGLNETRCRDYEHTFVEGLT